MAAAVLAPLLLLLRLGQAEHAWSASTTAAGPGVVVATQFSPQKKVGVLTSGVEPAAVTETTATTARSTAAAPRQHQEEGYLEVEVQEEGGKVAADAARQEQRGLFVPLTKRPRAGGAVYGVEVGEEGISRRKLDLVGASVAVGLGADGEDEG